MTVFNRYVNTKRFIVIDMKWISITSLALYTSFCSAIRLGMGVERRHNFWASSQQPII